LKHYIYSLSNKCNRYYLRRIVVRIIWQQLDCQVITGRNILLLVHRLFFSICISILNLTTQMQMVVSRYQTE